MGKSQPKCKIIFNFCGALFEGLWFWVCKSTQSNESIATKSWNLPNTTDFEIFSNLNGQWDVLRIFKWWILCVLTHEFFNYVVPKGVDSLWAIPGMPCLNWFGSNLKSPFSGTYGLQDWLCSFLPHFEVVLVMIFATLDSVERRKTKYIQAFLFLKDNSCHFKIFSL
jgi:hypothetical protein